MTGIQQLKNLNYTKRKEREVELQYMSKIQIPAQKYRRRRLTVPSRAFGSI